MGMAAAIGEYFFAPGGLFGDDQNKPPNLQPESDQVKEAIAKRRAQDARTEIAVMNGDQKRIQKENTALKAQLQEATQQKRELERKLQSEIATTRESQRRDAKRPTYVSGYPGMQVPMTSLNPAMVGSGKLPPGLKVRYNSASAGTAINAVVVRFNESDSTYDLDVRPHADTGNISPDPSVTQAEAWPPGSMVSYHSSSAGGRMLDAFVVSFIEGTGGLQGTYNLDLRECADADRIRPRVTGRTQPGP